MERTSKIIGRGMIKTGSWGEAINYFSDYGKKQRNCDLIIRIMLFNGASNESHPSCEETNSRFNKIR